MNLKAYLELNSMREGDFAEAVGISRASIFNYTSGRRTPTLRIARKIEKITKGKVTIDELLEYATKKRVQNGNGFTTDRASLDV